MTSDEQTIRSIVTKARFASFASRAADGQLLARPMTPVRIDDDWTFLFIAERGDLADQADGQPVNLAFFDGTDCVSISGTGEIRDDVALKQELWSPAVDAFCSGGPESSDNIVIAVHGASARYWDSPSGPVVLASLLKAKVTGEQPQAGESGTVSLH